MGTTAAGTAQPVEREHVAGAGGKPPLWKPASQMQLAVVAEVTVHSDRGNTVLLTLPQGVQRLPPADEMSQP